MVKNVTNRKNSFDLVTITSIHVNVMVDQQVLNLFGNTPTSKKKK